MGSNKRVKRNSNGMSPGYSGSRNNPRGDSAKSAGVGQVNIEDNYGTRLHQESEILQRILPAKLAFNLQSLIAKRTDDPDTLENLMNSSPYFREQVHQKRVLFLSKKVFTIFHKWQYPEFYTSRNQMKNKGLLELVKWRQVCTSWCSSLDQLLEEDLIDCRGISGLGSSYGACGKVQMTKFQKHFEKTHSTFTVSNARSPFIGRYLPVGIFVDQSGEDCWIELLCLLRMYGHHIWHLRYEAAWDPATATPDHFYFYFRQILKLTPNLRSLLIYCSNADNLTDAVITRGLPLPKLVHLKMIKICKAPASLFANLLQTNSHISTLILHFKEGYNCNVQLENLKELDLISRHPWGTFRKFVPPPVGSWPVKKLCWDDRDTETSMTWKGAFRMISKTWGNTLEELSLKFPDIPEAWNQSRKFLTLNDSLAERLYLPKLKDLKMWVSEKAFTLDFLLDMQSLETLSFFTVDLNPDSAQYNRLFISQAEEKQIVQFVGCEDKMYESNIWNMLGKLRSLSVYGKLYLRTEWMRSTQLTNGNDMDMACEAEQIADPSGKNEDNSLSHDSDVLQSILPACCWQLVTTHLAGDPGSLKRLSNSSPYFRDLLKDQRVLFLSKDVFFNFVFWQNPEGICATNNQPVNNEVIRELWKWGQVCLAWFHTMNKLLARLINWYGISSVLGERYALNNTAQVRKFLRHFQQTDPTQLNERCPFIGGYLQVAFPFEDGEDFYEYLSLFRKYGHLIRNFSYGFSGNPAPGTSQQFYPHFRQMLTLMPNLFSLTLCHSGNAQNFTEESIRRQALPQLLKLSSLNFVEADPVLFSHMLKKYNDVSRLEVNFKEGYNFNVKLRNLNSFRITSQTEVGNLTKFVSPKYAESWPITWLRWYDNGNEGCRKWKDTFKLISDTWGRTLKELDINLPDTEDRAGKLSALNDSLKCRLNLPWVRRLELGVKTSACVIAFDFLLEMTLLDTVAIWSDVFIPKTRQGNRELVVEAEKRQIVQFVGYENKMLKSNVWTLFKKLKTLTVYRKLYLRSEWEVTVHHATFVT